MQTDNNFIPLEAVKVATPCRADWDKMTGTNTVRFCQTCTKNVYNLSGMTREAAEALVNEKEGKLCVRFYQRADGTMLTQDCPVGTKMARRPFYWLAAGFAAFLVSGVAIAQNENTKTMSPCPVTPPVYAMTGDRWASLRQVPILAAVVNRVSPPPVIMSGEMSLAE